MSLSASPRPKSRISGFLLVNKPSGPTSFDLIRWLRRIDRDLKIGHAGTLDPLASGLMILLFGSATKRQDSFMKQDKTYFFGVRLGKRTSTGDAEGEIVEEGPVPTLASEDVFNVTQTFLGDQNQIPPMFAAIKKNGVPLYKLARRGETVVREPRAITIRSLEMVAFDPLGLLTLRVRCSSGTYVRSLAEDLGARLGTFGTIEFLVRESIGNFDLSGAISGEVLKNLTLETLPPLLKELPVS